MSTSSEKRRSLEWTLELLEALLQKNMTPRVPENIRERARRCIRHYPGRCEIANFKMTGE